MSVCNGAFTLANTGLLDGLSATTTAGNINRLRQTYPAITVKADQRIVDNGKIITTAGLSAGLDGALHVIDLMKGEGAGQSVALYIEYDWRPNGSYVRGTMADRFIPNVFHIMAALKAGDDIDESLKGDGDRWDTKVWYSSKLQPAELSARLKAAYTEAYALDGPWAPGSVRLDAAGPLATNLQFADREGRHWQGVLSVEPEPDDTNQVAVHIAVHRADQAG